jgi:hypothetical protein
MGDLSKRSRLVMEILRGNKTTSKILLHPQLIFKWQEALAVMLLL